MRVFISSNLRMWMIRNEAYLDYDIAFRKTSLKEHNPITYSFAACCYASEYFTPLFWICEEIFKNIVFNVSLWGIYFELLVTLRSLFHYFYGVSGSLGFNYLDITCV